MINLNQAGRWIGAAILAGYVLDIGSNFFLQPAIRTGEGAMGLLGGAAAQPALIGTVVLAGLVSGVIAVAAAALLCQLTLGRQIAWLGILYLALKASSFGMGGGEFASFQVFRTLGEAMLADPSGQLAALAEPVKILVAAQRDGLHFPHMLIGGSGAFVLYLLLLKAGFVPRWLGLAGLAASASQMAGVFTGVLGHEVSFLFLAPLALVHLTLALWLLVRGFAGEQLPSGGSAAS